MKSGIFAGLLLATVSAAAAFAQGAPIKLANVAELSGGGATVGTNWKNGIDLAIEEINAKGGVARPQARSHACGFAIESRRRARAGAEGARQRALRPARARLFRIGQGHCAARRRSRHRADHGRRSRRTDAGRQQVPVPHLVRPAILDAEGRQIHQRRAEGEIGRDRLGQQRFRQGRPRRHHQGIRQVQHQGRRRPLDRSRPGRFRRRRQQDQGRGARCGVRLCQRGRERADAERAEAPGRSPCR